MVMSAIGFVAHRIPPRFAVFILALQKFTADFALVLLDMTIAFAGLNIGDMIRNHRSERVIQALNATGASMRCFSSSSFGFTPDQSFPASYEPFDGHSEVDLTNITKMPTRARLTRHSLGQNKMTSFRFPSLVRQKPGTTLS